VQDGRIVPVYVKPLGGKTLQIQNANYEKVLYCIDKLLSEDGSYCRCHRCRMDVAALALNTLPPHYYVEAAHMRKVEVGSSWLLVEVAVREAAEAVRMHPNHRPPEDSPDAASLRDMPLTAE